MRVKDAQEIVGGLSKPSKMPGYAYNLPAMECNVGSALARIKGSVCFKCYARKGRYVFKSTIDAMYRRLATIYKPEWVEAMAFLINRYAVTKGYTEFRWHDSGDIQSEEHLENICEVCRRTPGVRHWLPTKEVHRIRKYQGDVPDNLCIRTSAFYIDKEPKSRIGELPFSTVHSKTPPEAAHECLAYRTDHTGRVLDKEEYRSLPKKHGLDLGHCGDCRACWSRDVEWVSYAAH